MRRITLLDGGMGQELIRRWRRRPEPSWSAAVLRAAPELVEQLHFDYIAAGSRVIILNSYSVTPERLAREGKSSEFEHLQALAIEVAVGARRRAQQELGVHVDIAGCLPPLVASYRPDVTPGYADCLRNYTRICHAQAAAVDYFLCETMASIAEAQAAAAAVATTDKACWTAFTVDDDDGRYLRSGEKLEAALEAMRAQSPQVLLINCSKPEATSQALALLRSSGYRYGAYANAFTNIAALQPGGNVEVLSSRAELDPEAYSRFALDWVEQGASVVGGCCEINPEHIAHLHSELTRARYQVTGADLELD